MSAQKQVFRSAWILSVGPGLAVAVALAVLIFKVNDSGLVPRRLALWLYLVPILILTYVYLRWLLRGHIAVTPRQITFQGWVRKTDKHGNTRRIRTKRMVPRSEGGSITIDGLLFPNVTWASFGDSFVFERVGRSPQADRVVTVACGQVRPGAVPRCGRCARVDFHWSDQGADAGCRGTEMVLALSKVGWPLAAAARTPTAPGCCKEGLPVAAVQVRSPASEYERFVAFCQDIVSGTDLIEVRNRQSTLYTEVLEQARILGRRVNGHVEWRLHPRIRDIQDITRRISPEAFEQAWFRALLADVDLGKGSPT